MTRHSRSVLAFHRRTTQNDELFHFELDMIPPMPPNPAFRPPPNSSSSSSGASGVAPGLPQLHNTVEPSGSGGVDSPSTPAPSPLDSESRNQPLINQNMDPAMPTLSPHPPPQKSGPDKDIGGGGGGGGGGSISGGGGNGGGGNSSGGGGSGASSGTRCWWAAGVAASRHLSGNLRTIFCSMVMTCIVNPMNRVPRWKLLRLRPPCSNSSKFSSLIISNSNSNNSSSNNIIISNNNRTSKQRQILTVGSGLNSGTENQNSSNGRFLPTNEVEDEQTLVTESLYDFQSLNSW